jgi:hypothetical protein
MASGSFYTDGDNTTTGVVEDNDVVATDGNSVAPSSFFSGGNQVLEGTVESNDVVSGGGPSGNPSSFFTDGNSIATGVVEDNDVVHTSGNNVAPSSFYPAGVLYSESDTDVAETYATNAADSAAAALASQNAAQLSETHAHTSETNSASSETNAAASAATATTQAGIATTKASEASTSAASAAASASTATTQAGIAATQAGISTTQAGIATTKASDAATSASNAAASASAAATSEANAAATLAGAVHRSGDTMTGGLAAPSFESNGGGLYLHGWGGNPNLSVIFMNASNSHYIYHDGTNYSLSAGSLLYAGNGRLWGDGDFSAPLQLTGGTLTGPITVAGTSVFTEMRGGLKAPSGYGYAMNNWTTLFQATPPSSMTFMEDQSGGGPTGTWWFNVNMRHNNGTNYWGMQQAWGWEDNANEFYTRNWSGGVAGAWVRHLNANNYSAYAVPLSGGTMTGALTVQTDVTVHRNNASGYVWLGNSGSAYVSFDGANYVFPNYHVYSAAGRLWGTNDFNYRPVSSGGDTITGSLTVNANIFNPGGVLYLNGANNRYLQFDGSNYQLPGSHLYTAAGRVMGTSTDANVIINGRLALAGDQGYATLGINEPYGGSVITGGGGVAAGNTQYFRFRYMQLQNLAGTWFTCGYV